MSKAYEVKLVFEASIKVEAESELEAIEKAIINAHKNYGAEVADYGSFQLEREYCGSCKNTHAVEPDPCYCVKCEENFDSGCMNEIDGEPVCFNCSEVK